MKLLSFSPRAETEIDTIWDYSASHWGSDQADAYTDAIRDTCRDLASGMRRGRGSNIRGGFLKCPCGSHVIWFRATDDRLDIIRILHGMQDVERHLHD